MMASGPRIALITGGNKGIGFEIVRKLVQLEGDKIHVIITSRNEERGKAALEKLRDEFPNAKIDMEILDVGSIDSINALVERYEARYGKSLDILINNAGIAYMELPSDLYACATDTFNTNLWGALRMTDSFLKFLKNAKQGNVVNIASMGGRYAFELCSEDVKNRWRNNNLTVDDVVEMASDYVAGFRNGSYKNSGYPNRKHSIYMVSKLAMIAMTNAYARQEPTLRFNSCCPGYVQTDINLNRGTKPVEEGADTPVFLALGAIDDPEVAKHTAQFWEERQITSFL